MSKLSSFQNEVKKALRKYSKPKELGEISLLASPYFLGPHLPPDATTALERGQALQAVLKRAASQIHGPYGDRWRRIIELHYFQRLKIFAVSQKLKISESQIKNTDLKAAVAQLADELVNLIRPALRLETPPAQSEQQLVRPVVFRRLLESLENRQSVFLAGVEGMGKSTLGSQLADAWPNMTFWYTIRPGLNDHIDSFVFSLAYFCYQHGSSLLWQEIISAQGQIPHQHLLEQTRYMFEQLPALPLLCIDDVDRLQLRRNADHVKLGEFIESIQSQVPMLLMGQEPNLQAPHIESLAPLSDGAAEKMLSFHSIFLTEKESSDLNQHLGGNPQLLELTIILLQNSDSVEMVLREIEKMPHARFLLERILRRLDEIQKQVLMELVVYEKDAPSDIWSSRQGSKEVHDAFQSLCQKRLIRLDCKGSVSLHPTYRQIFSSLLLESLSEEEVQQLHQNAAEVFLKIGQFTQAARHYAKSSTPEMAIWHWHDFKQQEISQGQAHAALSLFEEMRIGTISSAARNRAVDFCANLKHLGGLLKEALEDLQSVRSRPPIYEVEARQLEGIIHNDESRFDKAKQAFSEALSAAEEIVEARLAHAHKGIGWSYLQERQLDQAWQEALLARCEAEYLQGVIQRKRNSYKEAEKFYKSALELAKEAKYLYGVAKVYNQLSSLYTIQGSVDKAVEYAKLSLTKYKQIGRPIGIASSNINVALRYNLVGQFEKAIWHLEKCREQFQQFGLDIPDIQEALIHQGLAEAYLGLNQLDKATEHVQQAIEQEEIAFLPDSRRTYGEIMLRQGNVGEAQRQIQLSINLLEGREQPDAYLLGYAWRAMAEVHSASGNTALAKEAQAEALELFEQIGNHFELRRTKEIFGLA